MPGGPTIYRLNIERFRGLKCFSWRPANGLNLVLGGGDVGKTTILDAIAMLLSPTTPSTVADTDYTDRKIEDGFSIEAVVSLPSGSGISQQIKHSWPWIWDGADPVVPSIEGDADDSVGEPVYRLRVRGTSDLELVYEIVQPDETADMLSVGLRRAIGLVRLGGDDRNDRDLRLVQGSALDRLLSDKGLRSRLAREFASSEVKDELSDSAKEALTKLDSAFGMRSLPRGLDLAITGGQGFSIAALIGLTAQHSEVPLPLTSWGAGTRRVAALTIAEQNQGDAPITLVDEVERGLEPYRQRMLIERLRNSASQSFVTTHSPAAIAACSTAALWYVDHSGKIGSIPTASTERHRSRDPHTFLSRLTIVGEGATEVGFVSVLLDRAGVSSLQQLGVHITDGGGNTDALALLEAMAEGGLAFAGFVDEEGQNPSRWNQVKAALGPLLFRWSSGCVESNVLDGVADDCLEALISDPSDEKTGMRLRTLADRLGIDSKDYATISSTAGSALRDLIRGAMLGTVPDGKESERKHYKAHGQQWFKTEIGGRELAEKMFSLGAWTTLGPHLLPFCNAVRGVLGLPELTDLGAGE